MTGQEVTLRRAITDDLPYIETVLDENGLPIADIGSRPDRFYIASVEGTRVGTGGLERSGDMGLIRSIVVEQSARGEGIGTGICDALETTVRAEGIDTLYLLTTTAAGFFADRGYSRIDRSEPPDPIQQTAQFTDLCPMSAVCMKKSL